MKNINKILEYGKASLVASVLYATAILGIQVIPQEFSPKINKINLEQILNEERKRAGINDTTKINVQLSNEEEEVSYAQKINNGEYKIVLPKISANKNVLRHELYHIADGHCDEEFTNLKYFFIHEPQATIYSITGLKP
ncbi:MAG: hypothetical protein AABX80_02660 [Nanoarchaeota archaeon]